MKPLFPHDPLDDLIAAALHGDLSPEERAQFESRLSNDPAARAAYQEAQAMHDLLEKTHQEARPDTDFEQRMVSGVRRKLQHEPRRETAWESLVALWKALKGIRLRPVMNVLVVLMIIAVVAGVALGPITNGIKQSPEAQKRMMEREAELQAEQQTARDSQAKSSIAENSPSAFSAPAAPPPAEPAPTPPAATTAPTAASPSVATDTTSTASISGETDEVTSPMSGLFHSQSRAARIHIPTQSPVTKTGETDDLEAKLNSSRPMAGSSVSAPSTNSSSSAGTATAPTDNRKLIRDAQLDLEVKNYQAAVDQIGALTKSAGGYVDTSSSQRGGNGKLQGTIVVKVLPQNLDDFLLKLRGSGTVKNQSVTTQDVTRDYFDTQARLDNARRMETQLQLLLQHENSKVSDLLQVERELGRVRGQIEEMQGQLKLYDFEVQYATVTIRIAEKDLHAAAAYLLKEQDDFSLYATDVETTFQKARAAADDFKAQILSADLNHNSGSDVSAELVVMVAPDQIEPFLAQVRALGRVADFTRQTQRVANDGGDSDQPADETLTEKDKVQVHLTIRSDDDSRKQVALTVVTKEVDTALDQAKAAALAQAGAEILSSSLNKTQDGASTAALSVRVPGPAYAALMAAFRGLGRTAALSVQRNDNSGPGATGDDAPVIVSLSLTDDDAPVQTTELAVLASHVDDEAQQVKKDAGAAGVEVKASSFERQPDGTETAQMTFRLPMSGYAAFLETLKGLGKVESLSVHRDDRPDQARGDDTAPAEISLNLHNQCDIVADDDGLWATLRCTFGEGAGALFTSVRTIGVVTAFLLPWTVVLVLLAWTGRRIYVWRKR